MVANGYANGKAAVPGGEATLYCIRLCGQPFTAQTDWKKAGTGRGEDMKGTGTKVLWRKHLQTVPCLQPTCPGNGYGLRESGLGLHGLLSQAAKPRKAGGIPAARVLCALRESDSPLEQCVPNPSVRKRGWIVEAVLLRESANRGRPEVPNIWSCQELGSNALSHVLQRCGKEIWE